MISIVVKVKEGCCDSLTRIFEGMSHVRVFSIKGNEIVLILDTEDMHVVSHMTKDIQEMDGVIGVYPLFSGNLEVSI
jgi:nitrate reductase NapAB chaperone NapD